MKLALRLALFSASVALVLLAYQAGWVDAFKDPARIGALVRDAGALGVALYLTVFIALATAGVPAVVFMVPAPLLFPWPLAVGIATVGGMVSSTLSFWMARYVFRDFARAKIPPKLLRTEASSTSFTAIVVSRLVLFIIPPTNWALGLTSVPTRTYVAATFVGALPGFFFYTLLGGAFFAWLAGMPPYVWALACVVVVAAVIVRRRRAAI